MSRAWGPLSEAAEFKLLIPAFSRLPPAPRFSFGSFPGDVATSYYQHKHLWSLGVYEAAGLTLCDRLLVDQDGIFRGGVDVGINPDPDIAADWLQKESKAEVRRRHVDGIVAAIVPPGSGYRSFGIWLIDILPRLTVMVLAGYKLHDLWYPLPTDTPDFGRELLLLAGVPSGRFIDCERGEEFKADLILAPTLVHNNSVCSPVLSNTAKLLRAEWSRNGSVPHNRDYTARVFLANDDPTRHLMNQMQIQKLAESAGFITAYPGRMSANEVIALFASAREIIGEYGTAFHASLFSRPGLIVCGLRGSGYLPGFTQAGIGEALDQPTGWVFGTSDQAGEKDFRIEEQYFRDCLKLAFGPGANLASGQSGAPPTHGITIAEVERKTGLSAERFISAFESLGVNCEFGFVQRYCGAEPVSLLRFAGFPLKSLLQCLDRRFEGLGTLENLKIVQKEPQSQHYEIQDKLFSMEFHAMRCKENFSEQTLLLEHTVRLSFLKRKLIKDLEAGKKIFVWKAETEVAEEDVLSLFGALNEYAENTLLWVVEAGSQHKAGSIECLSPRLMKGYIDRFSPTSNVPDVSLNVWLELCVRAYDYAQLGETPLLKLNPKIISIP